MPVPAYQLKVITPQGVAYTGKVTHTRVPVENGSVGVLANHASYVTSSSGGTIEIRDPEGHEKKFTVGAGFFEVSRNEAVFLAQSFSAEPPSP